jgi:hypothetical protein
MPGSLLDNVKEMLFWINIFNQSLMLAKGLLLIHQHVPLHILSLRRHQSTTLLFSLRLQSIR